MIGVEYQIKFGALLQALPANSSISYGGLVDLKPGVYAIVEERGLLGCEWAITFPKSSPIRKEVASCGWGCN
jgi:hypothetical protein